jgi:ribosomal protein L40E
MNRCAKCGMENPQGSNFCAGCGSALPKVAQCISCGAENPPGSRFCKGCGKPLGAPAASTADKVTTRTGSGASPSAPLPNQNMQQIKGMLIAGACLYIIAIFMMYSELDALQSAYGAYASLIANTGFQWFLIVLDLVCAGVAAYAVAQLGKGQYKMAKTAFVIDIAMGAIFLLRGLSGPLSYILLNAALLAVGIWGWRLVSRELRPAA